MSKMDNYAEYIDSLPTSENIPNEETLAAIEEARSGKHAGRIDMTSFESFMKSCEDISD